MNKTFIILTHDAHSRLHNAWVILEPRLANGKVPGAWGVSSPMAWLSSSVFNRLSRKFHTSSLYCDSAAIVVRSIKPRQEITSALIVNLICSRKSPARQKEKKSS